MLGDLVKLAGIVKLIKRYESCNGLRDHGMGKGSVDNFTKLNSWMRKKNIVF